MKQVKLSVPDGGRLKAEEFTDPNETAWISIRRQEPSARTSFQQWFRATHGEIGIAILAGLNCRFSDIYLYC